MQRRRHVGLFTWVRLFGFLLLGAFSTKAAEALQPEIFFYMHKEAVRQGCFYKPEGSGPFPAMIYNQATPKPSIQLGERTPFLTLAKFYVSQGYALFLPGRPLLTEPSASSSPQLKGGAAQIPEEELLRILEGQNENIIAALNSIKAQAIVDVERIYMSGHSVGGIQTVLLAERSLGIKGHIAFSPAAKLWDMYPGLQKAMEKAVTNQKAPIFLIQPQNDLGFGPSIGLGPLLVKSSLPNRARIFSAYRKTQNEGNSFAFNAPDMWSKDVLEFMIVCKASSLN